MPAAFVPNEGQVDTLTTILAGGPYKIGLSKNNITPDKDTVLADVRGAGNIANYSGFAEQTPVYGAISINGSDQAQAVAAPLNFDHNGGGTSNTIYCVYLYNTVTNKLDKVKRLDTPKSMATIADRLTIDETFLTKTM